MFGLRKSLKDPLADVRTADRWISGFSTSDPLAVHAVVLGELGKLSDRNARRTHLQLAAVFRLDDHADSLRRTLTLQYLEQDNRSSRVESQLWQSLFDLSQAFLVCYRAFSQDLDKHTQNAKWQAMRPELLTREIIHLGLDAKTRLYR